MNETIPLSPRQKAILNTLAQQETLSREQINQKLLDLYPASKATLSRDLQYLTHMSKILTVGNGPARTYSIVSAHPLLKSVDLNHYFLLDPDQRNTSHALYDYTLIGKLSGLFSENEKDEYSSLFRSFSHATEVLSTTIRQRELERFMIELAWKSSKIEGNTYTLLETETLIQHSHESPGHTREEARMILNHKDAFKTIVEQRADFKNLTYSVVMELHNTLVKGMNIDSGIRKHAVGITGTTYRPLDNEWQIKEALEETLTVINRTESPLEKALIAASMISYIQPFGDGNKRTSRMLANAILLAWDYFPLSYRSIDVHDYKKALILFYETQNLYHVKRLFLDQYEFALKTYFV